MTARLVLALIAAMLVVVAGPFVGEIRTAVERTFPGQYLAVVIGAVVAPAVIALGVAMRRIRERRLFRYGALAAAIALAVLYAAVMDITRTEQFHFTEYGVLTLLFYRVWRARGDVTALVLPVCAGLVAGIADEWFQWFVPSRVGEMRDLALNAVGVACGLLFAVALEPPVRIDTSASARARQTVAAGVAVVIAAGAMFLHTVHLGYDIADPAVGRFQSHFSPSALAVLSAERAARWRNEPPAGMPLISREDHYLTEALFHVERRNRAYSEGNLRFAWNENLILERFYAPVLDFGSPGSRWASEQRANVAAQAIADPRAYVSDAYPFPIYAWHRGWFWGATAALIALVWLLAVARAPRASDVVSV